MGVIWQRRIPLPLSSDCLKFSKTNQNFSDLLPDILRVTSKTAHLVAFLFNSFIFDTGLILGLWFAIFSERRTENLPSWPVCAMESAVCPVIVGNSPQDPGSLLWPGIPPHSDNTAHRLPVLEGRFVATERDSPVSKTRPAWRDFKKKCGVPFHSYLPAGFAKLYKNNHSKEKST